MTIHANPANLIFESLPSPQNKPRETKRLHALRRGAPNFPASSVFQAPLLMGNPPISFFWSARSVINQI
jgi:hypothetical protein